MVSEIECNRHTKKKSKRKTRIVCEDCIRLHDELTFKLIEMVEKFAWHSTCCAAAENCFDPCNCGYEKLFNKIKSIKKVLEIR